MPKLPRILNRPKNYERGGFTIQKFPYALANFLMIREENYLYVDRTAYIRTLEELSGRNLLFVRPRRFGKSLWLNVLSRYYDVVLADRFDELFGSLDIGRPPTPLHNRYFVMTWNFSRIDSRGTVDEIANRMNDTLNSVIEEFLVYYEDILPSTISIKPQAIILSKGINLTLQKIKRYHRVS